MTTVLKILPFFGAAILVALAVYEAVYVVRHITCKPAHCKCSLPHKFLAGMPLHGQTVTDATYWRKANTDLTQSKTVGPFLKLPGWKRRAYRTGPFLAAAALLISPLYVGAALGFLLAVLVARRTGWGRGLRRWLLARRAARKVTGWLMKPLRTERARRLLDRLPVWLRAPKHHNRVQTMGMLLGDVTGTVSSVAEAGIDLDPSYIDTKPGEHVGRWVLPRGFKATGGEKNLAQDVWKSRIGFDLKFTWDLAADEPYMDMTRAREMPSIVYLHDVIERVEALPDSKTAIGLDDQDNLVCWDWLAENPHGMVVAGSRHGKTELNRSITAQVVRKGGRVGGVDCKRISFQGLENLPGFTLRNDARNIRAMWELIGEFYEEMERRSLERLADPEVVFPRWLLIIEEVNQFSAMSDDWWEELDAEDPRDEGTLFWKPKRGKKTPRPWRWVKSLCWEGAEFGMHVIVDGQDGEFQALKGVRNVLGMRLLGGYQPQQWKSCVGTTPVPEAPATKGRFCLVSGGQTWVQALCAHKDKNESASIWRDYARAGRGEDDTQLEDAGADTPVSGVRETSRFADLHEQVPGQVSGADVPNPAGLKLSEILERGLIPGMDADPEGRNLRTLRKWSTRYSDFPQPVGYKAPANTYDHVEVAAYAMNRLKEKEQAA